jgi:hypothetical protein
MSFIVGSVLVNTYCTASDVSAILNIPFTSITVPSLTQVNDLTVRATSYVDSLSGHNWKLNTVTENYDALGTGPRAGTIVLRNRPLISVTSVSYWDNGLLLYVAGANGFSGQFPNLQTYYVYLPEGKIVWHKLRLDDRLRYQVVYTYGYTTPPDFVRDLTSTVVAMDVLTFWGSQLGIQEDIGMMKKRLEQKKFRLEARCAQRPTASVG